MTKTPGSFELDRSRGRWSLLGDPEKGVGLRNAACALVVNGRKTLLGVGGELRFEEAAAIDDGLGKRSAVAACCRLDWFGVEWTVTFEVFPDAPLAFVQATVRNVGRSPVALGRCSLLLVDGNDGAELQLGPEPGQQTVFHCNCTPITQHVKRLASDGGRHDDTPMCHIFNPASNRTFNAAFLTFDRAEVRYELRYAADDGRIGCDAYCDFEGLQLAPGKSVASEKLMVHVSEGPYETLELWADFVNRIYDPPIPEEALVGWLGWAWVDGFTTELPESLVERNTAAIRRRLKGFDVDYVWISIANLKDGLPGNWLRFNDEKFPRGMEHSLGIMKERGFKPGFWMAPFWVTEGADGLQENWDNLLQNPDGTPRQARTWLWAYKAPEDDKPYLYCLDGSHPDTVKYLTRVMTAYRGMGVRYFMIDFLHGGVPDKTDRYHDKTMVRGAQVYRNALLALREAAGPDIHLLPATGAAMRNIGIANSSRIGADYGEGRHLQPRFKSYPATYEINGAERSASTPHRNCLQNVAATYFTHRRLWLNNVNVLTVDKPISRNEAEISATLFGMSGSPIMLGDDIDFMHEERLAMIKKLLPRPRGTAFPVDLFQRVYPEDYARVLQARIEKPWGRWSVLAVFNLDDDPTRIELTAKELGLKQRGKYRAFDFWNERYCGCFSKTLSIDVPGFSCRVLRLEEAKPHPWLLSTDMHIRQGELELEDVAWDKASSVLSGVAVRPAGETGALYIVAPEGWKPVDYQGLWVARDARDKSLVIRKQLEFEDAPAAWEIAFEMIA